LGMFKFESSQVSQGFFKFPRYLDRLAKTAMTRGVLREPACLRIANEEILPA
jgi:hypothetical protein